MAKIDLSKYGITGTTEVVYNPLSARLNITSAAAETT